MGRRQPQLCGYFCRLEWDFIYWVVLMRILPVLFLTCSVFPCLFTVNAQIAEDRITSSARELFNLAKKQADSTHYEQADSLFALAAKAFYEVVETTQADSAWIDWLGALDQWGKIKYRLNKYEEAIAVFNRGINHPKLPFHDNHPELGLLYTRLAITYNRLDKLDLSHKLIQKIHQNTLLLQEVNMNIAWD